MSADDDSASAIEHHRAEKDAFYADHPHSPIPADHRDRFAGLTYYPSTPPSGSSGHLTSTTVRK